jgi:hypothetical protein
MSRQGQVKFYWRLKERVGPPGDLPLYARVVANTDTVRALHQIVFHQKVSDVIQFIHRKFNYRCTKSARPLPFHFANATDATTPSPLSHPTSTAQKSTKQCRC